VWLATALAAGALAGCSCASGSSIPNGDTGGGARDSGGTDAAAAADTGTDAGNDSGHDAYVAQTDAYVAPVDMGHDAYVAPVDMGHDAYVAPPDMGLCANGATRSCYGGPAGTAGVGACRNGTQTCTAGAWSTTCVGQVIPATEVCNAVDDNCNGTVDDVAGAGTSCSTGNACTTGTQRCQGSALACVTTGNAPSGTACTGGTCNGSGTCVASTRSFICAYAMPGWMCDNGRNSLVITATDMTAAIAACRSMVPSGDDYCGVVSSNPASNDMSECTTASGSWCTTRPYCRFMGSTGSVCGSAGNAACNCP
jgi:hypothetical protein